MRDCSTTTVQQGHQAVLTVRTAVQVPTALKVLTVLQGHLALTVHMDRWGSSVTATTAQMAAAAEATVVMAAAAEAMVATAAAVEATAVMAAAEEAADVLVAQSVVPCVTLTGLMDLQAEVTVATAAQDLLATKKRSQ